MLQPLRRVALFTAIGLLTAACGGPPRAPKELEELASFLFENTREADDDELADGLENLGDWLDDGYQEASEGYKIRTLSQAAADNLDGRSFDLAGLTGAAVASRIQHKIKPVVKVVAVADSTKVYGNTYEEYQRTWDTDATCHVERECAWGEADIRSVADYGIAKVESRYRSEYRWVETANGWAHLQRTWLLEPIEALGIETVSQFYLAVSLSDGHRTERLQATWVAFQSDTIPLSTDAALNQTIKSLIETEEDIDIWLD